MKTLHGLIANMEHAARNPRQTSAIGGGNFTAAEMAEAADQLKAAPALLFALQALLHQVEYMGAPEDHPDMIAARAAVAQAEGTKP